MKATTGRFFYEVIFLQEKINERTVIQKICFSFYQRFYILAPSFQSVPRNQMFHT